MMWKIFHTELGFKFVVCHAHGVFWVRKDIIEDIKNDDDFNDKKVVKVIDK